MTAVRARNGSALRCGATSHKARPASGPIPSQARQPSWSGAAGLPKVEVEPCLQASQLAPSHVDGEGLDTVEEPVTLDGGLQSRRDVSSVKR